MATQNLTHKRYASSTPAEQETLQNQISLYARQYHAEADGIVISEDTGLLGEFVPYWEPHVLSNLERARIAEAHNFVDWCTSMVEQVMDAKGTR